MSNSANNQLFDLYYIHLLQEYLLLYLYIIISGYILAKTALPIPILFGWLQLLDNNISQNMQCLNVPELPLTFLYYYSFSKSTKCKVLNILINV